MTPVRCFPFSAPEGPLALCDERGTELCLLPSLEALSSEARALVEEELARWEFVPTVRRIRSIVPEDGASLWQVETDRGETCVKLPSEDHLRLMGAHAVVLSDAHGVRYRIPDTRALDRRSRGLLSRFL